MFTSLLDQRVSAGRPIRVGVIGAGKFGAGLVAQVSAPVQWHRSMLRLADLGVNLFVEVGPGRVLCGLLRQINKQLPAANVEDEKSLLATLAKVKA